MAATFNAIQREKIKEAISPLFLRGLSTREIAESISTSLGFEVSHAPVATYQKKILAEWKDHQQSYVHNAVQVTYKEICEVEREYWKQWEESKKPRTQKTVKRKGQTKGNQVEASNVEMQEQETSCLGDPRYLEGVERCIKQKRELFCFSSSSAFLIADTTPGQKPEFSSISIIIVLFSLFVKNLHQPLVLLLDCKQTVV